MVCRFPARRSVIYQVSIGLARLRLIIFFKRFRQTDKESGAFIHFTLKPDLAIVLLNDLLADGKSQTKRFLADSARAFGIGEHVELLVLHIFGDAVTMVFHSFNDVA